MIEKMSAFLQLSASLVDEPISKVILYSLGLSVILYLLCSHTIIKSPWPGRGLILGLAAAVIYYFGFLTFITIVGSGLVSLVIGRTILKRDDVVLAFIVGFFIVIQTYILLAFIFDLQVAVIVLAILTPIILALKRKTTIELIKQFPRKIDQALRSLNPFDYFVVGLAFIIGSSPQYHWDAIHSSLYNAKWYVEGNSFQVIPESISSLFPQNAIGYYSFFYKIGGWRTLQIGYLLPLVLTLGLTKKIARRQQWPAWLGGLMYSLLLTPIVIFQSASGYYDLLVAALMISVYYLVVTADTSRVMTAYVSVFFIGFAAAIKYFPVAILPLLLGLWTRHTPRIRRQQLVSLLIGLVLLLLPLSLWSARTYRATGSPVFPFLQQFFPTPELWNPANRLEDHPINQTPTTVRKWLAGGFVLYPLRTYLDTDKYMEAYQGYPGVATIALMAVVVLVFLLSGLNVLRRRPITKADYLFWTALAAYILIGTQSRYYRYLWPFQLLLSLAALTSFSQYLHLIRKITPRRQLILVAMSGLLIFSSVVEITRNYRHYPGILTSLWQPENPPAATAPGPLAYLTNHLAPSDKPVLDASLYLLPRIFVPSRVYECNWYWIEGVQKMRPGLTDQEITDLMRQFSYVVYASPKTDVPNLCSENIKRSLELGLLDRVYADDYYSIYRLVTS